MQSNPALPWTPADGGRIILAEPITEQEILAGALDFIVRGGTPETDIHLQIVLGSGVYDLQLDGDTLWNIEKITGEQTELKVNSTLTGVEGYNLISIERLKIYFYPQLPWGEVNGRIYLSEPITQEDILQGKLRIKARGGTPESDYNVEISNGPGFYFLNVNGVNPWTIDTIYGPSTELNLHPVNPYVQGYNIVSIERIE